MKKLLLTMALLLGVNLLSFAQIEVHIVRQYYSDATQAPHKYEKTIGKFTMPYKGKESKVNTGRDAPEWSKPLTKSEIYDIALKHALKLYGGDYPDLLLRNLKCDTQYKERSAWNSYDQRQGTVNWYDYLIESDVVVKIDIRSYFIDILTSALNKSLKNIDEGARFAIDQIDVSNETAENETKDILTEENIKDMLLDILLDKGYRVVAKEYLERLYKEQQDQQSGIFNNSTTVQENNFSAVGFFINIKVSKNAIRTQVVNVSTGEYEGNATVNY